MTTDATETTTLPVGDRVMQHGPFIVLSERFGDRLIVEVTDKGDAMLSVLIDVEAGIWQTVEHTSRPDKISEWTAALSHAKSVMQTVRANENRLRQVASRKPLTAAEMERWELQHGGGEHIGDPAQAG